MEKPTIYLAETEDRVAFINKVLEKIRPDFVQAQMKVLVKPNIVSLEPYPTTTHPQVLAAVLDFLLDCGCRVVVVDGPAFDAGNSERIISSYSESALTNHLKNFSISRLNPSGFPRVLRIFGLTRAGYFLCYL